MKISEAALKNIIVKAINEQLNYSDLGSAQDYLGRNYTSSYRTDNGTLGGAVKQGVKKMFNNGNAMSDAYGAYDYGESANEIYSLMRSLKPKISAIKSILTFLSNRLNNPQYKYQKRVSKGTYSPDRIAKMNATRKANREYTPNYATTIGGTGSPAGSFANKSSANRDARNAWKNPQGTSWMGSTLEEGLINKVFNIRKFGATQRDVEYVDKLIQGQSYRRIPVEQYEAVLDKVKRVLAAYNDAYQQLKAMLDGWVKNNKIYDKGAVGGGTAQGQQGYRMVSESVIDKAIRNAMKKYIA